MNPTGETHTKDTAQHRSGAVDSFTQICTVRIELLDTDPPIWREVEAPTSITLKVLHDIVQITMGWLDQHLWEFTIDKKGYGPPMDEHWGAAPTTDAIKVRLRDVLKPRKTTIDYLYDFGDNWHHRITVTKVRPGLPDVSYPHYVDGEWGCPPEDCGGIPGYYNMLDALADPEHPDHAEVAEYLEDWDPKEIDEFPLRIALSRIANRRNAARTRIAKKTS
jgi:hypothetical protein